MPLLLYGCTPCTQIKHMEKELDRKYARMLLAVLNKSWKQRSIKELHYGHLPPISQNILGRRSKYDGHCRWNKDSILLWASSRERSARTYIHKLCADTWCHLEDLLGVINYKDGWRERIRERWAIILNWYIYIWTPAYGQAKAGQPARTYIQPLCEDTGCSSEDQPEAMNDREK